MDPLQTNPEVPVPASFEELKQVLKERSPDLSPRLLQIAEFALEHPDAVAFGTVAEIAQKAEVQPSTLVRFAQAIGFAGFSELQQIFRARLTERWPSYDDRLRAIRSTPVGSDRDPLALFDGFAETAVDSVLRLRGELTSEGLEAAVRSLAAADTIFLLGQRRAYPVSSYLAYALAKLGVRSRLLDNGGSMLADQAAFVGNGDALLAISFNPYTPATLEFTASVYARGVTVVTMTDSPLSPLARVSTHWFEVVEADLGSFRSLSASFCLAMTLAVVVAERRSG